MLCRLRVRQHLPRWPMATFLRLSLHLHRVQLESQAMSAPLAARDCSKDGYGRVSGRLPLEGENKQNQVDVPGISAYARIHKRFPGYSQIRSPALC